jgi:hypothetical protein
VAPLQLQRPHCEYYTRESKTHCNYGHIMLEFAFDGIKTLPEETRNLKAAVRTKNRWKYTNEAGRFPADVTVRETTGFQLTNSYC